METMRLNHMKEACFMLFRTIVTDDIDCLWWQTKSCEEDYLAGHKENEIKITRSQTVEHLFSTKKARLAFKNPWKFEVAYSD